MSEQEQRAIEPADVVDAMVEIRDARKELKKQYELEDSKLREKWERGERWLLKHLKDHRLNNMGIDNRYTVFKSESLRASIGDWLATSEYIAKTGEVDLLEHRVSAKSVKEYMEANNGQVPPGISTDTRVAINIRKQ